MAASMLCHQVTICKLIDTLDEDKCLDVLRLLRDELQCNSLNRLLIKLIFRAQDALSVNSLNRIETSIQQIIAKDTKPKLQTRTEIKDSNSINSNMELNAAIFPFHRLPIDLVTHTSFFLNERDIFRFEQCCRMFYETINNTSYLNKCNNFKTFEITKQRLKQMCDSKCSFYKYSKADVLQFELCEPDRSGFDEMNRLANDFLREHEPLWNNAHKKISNSNWYINLMKSIRLIKFNAYSSLFLDKLPVDILFDPKQECRLEGVFLDHFHEGLRLFKTCINAFEKKYLNLRNKLNQRGEKIGTLEFINHTNNRYCQHLTITGPRYVAAKYVWFDSVTIDGINGHGMSLNSCNEKYRIYSYPGLKMITFVGGIQIKNFNSIANINVSGINTSNSNINCGDDHINIETMRLIDYRSDTNTSSTICICNNKKLIESWNLHNSLKNLTLVIAPARTFYDQDLYQQQWKQWLLAIKNVLTKEYYFNLENVNILIYDISKKNCHQAISIFKILQENKSILKHQFKQLNIGFRILKKSCYILKWDDNINDKLLEQKKSDILEYIRWCWRDTTKKPKRMPSKQTLQEYDSMKEQWVPMYDIQSEDKLLK